MKTTSEPNPFHFSQFIPCIPAGQPRAKATAIGGKARMYSPTMIGKKGARKPHPVIAFRQAIVDSVRSALPPGYEPRRGPFRVDIMAWFPRLPNKTRKTKPNPWLWHTAKPDKDNLEKAVYDCLTKIVWKDDSQVCDGGTRKIVVRPGEPYGIHLAITELTLIVQ